MKLNITEKITKSCIKNDIIAKKYKILKKIGTESSMGDVYLTCVKIKDKFHEIVLKKIPLTEYFFYIHENKKFTVKNIKYFGFLIEVYFLKICKRLSRYMPHVPIYFSNIICDKECSFSKLIMKREIYEDPYKGCGYLVVEKADGDLNDFLNKNEYVNNHLLVVYFQIFVSLYFLQINLDFRFSHGDLHWGNVLYKKTEKKQGNYIYLINGKKLKIPDIGYRFFIWDFGISSVKGINDKENSSISVDFFRVVGMLRFAKNKSVSNFTYKYLQKILRNNRTEDAINDIDIKQVLQDLSLFINIEEDVNVSKKTIKTFNVKKINSVDYKNILKETVDEFNNF